jgi:parallel beta-helix repeat protein
VPTSAIFPFGTGSTIYYPGYSVTTSGAVGDGVTDNSAVVIAAQTIAAAAGQALFFPAGSYVFNSSVAFTVPVVFADGAELLPQTGAVLSFAAPIDAQPTQIFSTTSGGMVTITGATPLIYPQWWGASGNGSTDNTAALTAASAALATNVGLYFPPGTYYFASSYTTTVPFTFASGTVIQVASTKTFAFTAPLIAGPEYCLSLATGTFTIDGHTPVIYAEWFGAKGNGTTDDSAAINAALTSIIHGGVVRLLAKPYKISSPIAFVNNSTTLEGTTVGPSPYDSGGGLVAGTQIIGTSAVNGINIVSVDYPTVRNLGISLAVGATAASIGIQIASCFNAKVVDVRVTNFGTAIQLNNGNTDTYIERVYAASLNATYSPVVGIEVNGTTTQNASVYISNTIMAHSGFTGSAYGFWLHGTQISDVFLDQCEADGCSYGYYVNGTSATALYNMDIHFRGCLADSFPAGGIGFYILNLDSVGNGSILEIINGWCAGGNASSFGVYVAGTSARVRVSGMQMTGATGLGIGIYIQGSNGCVITENIIENCSNTGIVVDNSPCTTVANNSGYGNAAASMGYFIQLLTGSTHVSIMGNVANASVAGGITTGIATPAGCDYCNIIGNCIPSSAVTTPYSLALGSNTHSVQLGTTA